MLYLATGTPGAGKSLNTIKFVNEEPSFKDRPVYYFNIRDLDKAFNWTELSESESLEWFNLPEGAIIVFDEAYDIFPQRGPTKAPPEHVRRLATHRHRGYDIVLICQKVKGQLDSFIRGLVNYHYHYERHFGSQVVTRYSWERCIDEVNGYHERKQALKKVIKYDKKYFGAYHSAEVHTVTRRLPMFRLAAFPVLLSLIGYCLYTGYDSLMGSDESEPEHNQAAQHATEQYLQAATTEGFQPANFRTSEQQAMDWYEARQARVPGFAHTAPVYDEVTKPVTFPRPNCVVWDVYERERESECRCYSQQATRMDVPPDICLQIVKNGWFDHTKPDNEIEAEYARSRNEPRERAQPAVSRGYVPPESYLIEQGDNLIWQASAK